MITHPKNVKKKSCIPLLKVSYQTEVGWVQRKRVYPIKESKPLETFLYKVKKIGSTKKQLDHCIPFAP
jgi:hypothetical protein